jgi:hypothetical protein
MLALLLSAILKPDEAAGRESISASRRNKCGRKKASLAMAAAPRINIAPGSTSTPTAARSRPRGRRGRERDLIVEEGN